MARLQEVVEQQRRALAARERVAVGRLASAYGATWGRLEPQVRALTAEVERRRAAGELVSLGGLRRLERLRALQDQVAARLVALGRGAGQAVRAEQRWAVERAGAHLRRLTAAARGTAPTGVATGVTVRWNRVPREALEHLVGALSDGSPLVDLLAEVAGDGAREFGRVLTTGLALGLHPRVVAAQARAAVGVPLARTLRIARTETLRAYREATRQELLANRDAVTGWTWHASLDARCCAGCWAMSGSVHAAEETLDGHPSCRCAMVPLTKSWEELGFKNVPDARPTVPLGTDEFERASADVQRAVLGPAAYEEFRAGRLKLVDLLARRDDARWGTMRYARSLKAVRAGRGGELLGEAARAGAGVDDKPPAELARERILALPAERLRRLEELKSEMVALSGQQDELTSRALLLSIGSTAREEAHTEIGRVVTELEKLAAEHRAVARSVDEQALDVLRQEPALLRLRPSGAVPSDVLRAAQEGLDTFAALVGRGALGDAPVEVELRFEAVTRAHFDPTSNAIVLARDDADVMVHELGHWLEARVTRVNDRAQAFYARRTAGEAVEKMSDATGDKGYGDGEFTRRDKFLFAYMGSVPEYYRGKHSEIVSMGLEQLVKDAVHFAKGDADYFDFIFDLLREGS